MGIEHYGFAFFVFCLVCLGLVIYSKLFSDVKRQKKLLDEKENKLLRLYQSIEEALDDFNDSVEKGLSELEDKIKSAESRFEAREFTKAPPVPQQQRRSVPRVGKKQAVDITLGGDEEEAALLSLSLGGGKEQNPAIPALAIPGNEGKADFKSLLDTVRQVEVMPPTGGANRNESILTLSREGKTRGQIAKELGITLSEVDLVLGMNRPASKPTGKG